jgi:hypothetical protein
MGYTHYFERKIDGSNDPQAYALFREGAEKLILEAQATGITIADGFGDKAGYWENTENRVAFNGLGEDSHETFGWDAICPINPIHRAGKPFYFDFCKTARKPYDAVVTACLILLKQTYGEAVQVSSDGSWSEWQAGRDLYTTVFGVEAPAPFEDESVSI